jgi:CheY-like chemotaxis protein
MGGTIWLDSAPGVGTCFFFTARFVVHHAPTTAGTSRYQPGQGNATPAPSDGESSPSPQFRNARILVVEDNNVNVMVINKMLAKLGYKNITTVADGSDAVKICQETPIDIILMDIQMRVMDGYTATEKIRAQQNAGGQPWIIALTAGVQQADTDRAFASGMNAFATKPIQLHELHAALIQAEKSLYAASA